MNSVGPSCSLSRQIGQESLIYNLQSRKTNRQKQIRCYSYFLNKVVKQKMSNKTKKNTKLQRQLSNFRKNPAIRLPIHVAVQCFAIFKNRSTLVTGNHKSLAVFLSQVILQAYLIFVTGTTGGAGVKIYCQV